MQNIKANDEARNEKTSRLYLNEITVFPEI